MRVFHVCSIYKPSNGIYFVLKNLGPKQRELGNEVKILNIYRNGYYDADIEYCEYEDFKHLITSNPPDVVIFHGVFNKKIITFSSLLRKKRIPYLIELHGALSRQNIKKSPIKKFIYTTLFLNYIIKKAKGIIYLNNNELLNSTITRRNSNSIIIPNGCEEVTEISEHKNKILELLFIGRLDRDHKGLDIMIPAVKKAHSNGVKFHLSIYGRGYKDELDWLKKELKGYEGVIDFYGEVFGVKKQEAFLKADVLLLTSRYEGFPITILEALAYGVPCIVTPSTNVADLISGNKCGWVTDLSVDAISSTIKKAAGYSRTEIIRMAENCILTAADYNWEKIAKLSLDLYS
ncbi:MAG: glycosyltransferase [Muribaculaceae bacterium]|nr:glycosyltransferase [Muribaculaceae bacterium]